MLGHVCPHGRVRLCLSGQRRHTREREGCTLKRQGLFHGRTAPSETKLGEQRDTAPIVHRGGRMHIQQPVGRARRAEFTDAVDQTAHHHSGVQPPHGVYNHRKGGGCKPHSCATTGCATTYMARAAFSPFLYFNQYKEWRKFIYQSTISHPH